MIETPEYDYVIVGAGSAGCTLAGRLAEDTDVSVLLIEAGGPARNPFITMPAGNGFLFGNPEYDWGHASVPQKGLNGRRIYYPRGKGVGGSSNLNGMIYMRGNRRDYDGWRQLGLEGWGYADMLPYFKRSEASVHRQDGFHGTQGPLTVCPAENYNKIDRMFVEAARQAGMPSNDDFNGAVQTGVGQIDTCVDRGRRQSAARAYLPSRASNLTVITGAVAARVELENRRATGLTYVKNGREESVRAAREVILSLGAFGSPKLLMLSGIGPAGHLREIGIEPLHDLPGVGENLHDHPNMPVQFRCNDPALSFARYQRLDRAIGLGAQYYLTRKGPGAGPFWGAQIMHSPSDDDYPTTQTYFTPMVVRENLTDASEPEDEASLFERLGRRILVRGSKTAVAGFQFDINLMRPRSSGRVRLASSDVEAEPLIDPNYLSDPQDVKILAEGVRIMRDIAHQPALSAATGKELTPGSELISDEELDPAIRALVTTGHHPVGTCKMGRNGDAMAVLDSELRVRGIDGLRVVDASVFPTQITGNPNAPIIAIAEKASDMILERPPLSAEVIPATDGPRKLEQAV